ncbi:MAG: hypothetical protein VYE22_04320 [Myxococcota bacterium]|nr:hypothetical protein [Myxococcota bacterium]
MSEQFRSNGMESRLTTVADVEVRVTSYVVGKRYSCRIDNVDPGGNIARATGATREEAESAALDNAALTLEMQSARARLTKATSAIRQTPANGVRDSQLMRTVSRNDDPRWGEG